MRYVAFIAFMAFGAHAMIDPAFAGPRGPELRFAVNVRAIGADGAITNPNQKEESLHIDSRIEDLRKKLLKIPFQNFRLIAAQNTKIPMRQKDRIKLGNGQSLTLRPIDFGEHCITMWLRWDGSDGMNILDTRLQFSYGESMLAGIEGQEDNGTVLAISVSPSDD